MMWNEIFEIDEELVEEFHEKDMSRKKRRERKNKEKMHRHSIINKNTRNGIGLRERPDGYFVSRNSKKALKSIAHRKERHNIESELSYSYKTISRSKPFSNFPNLKKDNTAETPLIRVVLQI